MYCKTLLLLLQGVDSAKDLSDDNLKANGLFQPAQPTNSYPFASSGEPTSNNSNSANGGSVNSQVGFPIFYQYTSLMVK